MSRILEQLADQHEERIINVLYQLEDDVINEVTKATKGSLVSQRLAIQLRPQIKALVEKNFLNEADLIINEEYNQIAKEVLNTFGKMPIPAKFKSLTEVDLQTINALKFQSFSGFEDIAERFTKVINDEVYQSTIAGRPFNDMVSNIRSHINGVYKRSNINEINELVDFINENKFDSTKKLQIEDAVRKLHTQYASDRAGNNLRRYAGQIAHDSVMQFHGQFTVSKAKEAGLDHFTYTGTLVRDSREFCISMLNKTLTEKQIREMWNTRSWGGKSTGDPFIVRGGYRCRHTWIPTDPKWGEETVDELPKEIEVEETPKQLIKKGRRSTLNNPVKESEVNVISSSIVANKLQKQIAKNAKDERYNTTTMFSESNLGKVLGVEKLDDEIASQLSSIMEELDELANLYNVPKLRSININSKGKALASMGAGSLKINPKYFNKSTKNNEIITRQRNVLLGKGFYEYESKLAKKYKRTDNITKENYNNKQTWVRPHNSFYFFENEIDKFRSVLYHEFGHTVHQLKNRPLNHPLYKESPIEELMVDKVFEEGRKFYKNGSTRYSATNTKEWFAENFSLYHMGKEDLTDPRFIQFLEEDILK